MAFHTAFSSFHSTCWLSRVKESNSPSGPFRRGFEEDWHTFRMVGPACPTGKVYQGADAGALRSRASLNPITACDLIPARATPPAPAREHCREGCRGRSANFAKIRRRDTPRTGRKRAAGCRPQAGGWRLEEDPPPALDSRLSTLRATHPPSALAAPSLFHSRTIRPCCPGLVWLRHQACCL